MTNVNCKGTETSLTSCDYDAPTNTCNHYKDAGVQCNYRKANFHKVGGNMYAVFIGDNDSNNYDNEKEEEENKS